MDSDKIDADMDMKDGFRDSEDDRPLGETITGFGGIRLEYFWIFFVLTFIFCIQVEHNYL